MTSPFLMWEPDSVKNGFLVTELFGVERVHRMKKGESFEAIFPKKAHFRFDPDFKRNTALVDCVLNIHGMMLCSERVKDFVMAKQPEALEVLPVPVLDHKKKPVEASYFLLHPTMPPDCIDFKRSKVERSPDLPELIMDASHLVIDPAKVPAARLIFRPKGYHGVLLIRRELVAELRAAGFSGAGGRELP